MDRRDTSRGRDSRRRHLKPSFLVSTGTDEEFKNSTLWLLGNLCLTCYTPNLVDIAFERKECLRCGHGCLPYNATRRMWKSGAYTFH